MSDALRADLSGPAARFAQLLRDFGHLDDATLAELYLEVAEHASDSGVAQVDLESMRRTAAAWLFVRQAADLNEGEGILSEDWPLLFS